MAAADNQRKRGILDARAGFENHGVNVPFDVVDRDQRQIAGEAKRLGVGDADEQRSDQARAFGNGDGG